MLNERPGTSAILDSEICALADTARAARPRNLTPGIWRQCSWLNDDFD